jgi:predicted dehydrogenase
MTVKRGVVVGGGAVGSKFHVPRILEILQCDDVSIVDTNTAQRKTLSLAFRKNHRVTICSSIPSGDFDIAVVATPPKYHYACFNELSTVCKNIIVEKPLAKTPQEAKNLAKLADDLGVRVYVGLIRRSLSNFSIIRGWIESGLFGKLQSLYVAEGMVFSWDAVSQGSFSKDLNGGGVLMDTGPHTLDQLYQLFSEVEVRSAWLDALPLESSAAIEANASIELLCDGIPVSVVFSRNRVLSNTAKFSFENATVELGLHSDSIRVTDVSGHQIQGLPRGVDREMSYQELFDAYYRNYILKRNNQGISATDSLRLQELICSIYDGAQLMKGHF